MLQSEPNARHSVCNVLGFFLTDFWIYFCRMKWECFHIRSRLMLNRKSLWLPNNVWNIYGVVAFVKTKLKNYMKVGHES